MVAVASSSDPTLRIARVLHGTRAEGPGLRTAVWMQGCSIRCAGCINPHLFSARGGIAANPVTILDEAEESGAEGLTLLGGEPFDQARAVAVLARGAQARGLGVICFTGHHYEYARTLPGGEELLAATDLLCDGPYRLDEPDTTRALVGSTNQRFIHLTERYRHFSPEAAADRVELRIDARGQVDVAGFLTADDVDRLAATLETRRVLTPPNRRRSLNSSASTDPAA